MAEVLVDGEYVPDREEHDSRLVNVLRYIASSCAHSPDLQTGNHIHEPTTGGERFCGPCHAWRTLNGSPEAFYE